MNIEAFGDNGLNAVTITKSDLRVNAQCTVRQCFLLGAFPALRLRVKRGALANQDPEPREMLYVECSRFDSCLRHRIEFTFLRTMPVESQPCECLEYVQ